MNPLEELTILERMKNVLSEVTVTDPASIELESDLELDLGIDMDVDFSRVIKRIMKEFELHTDAKELLEEATIVGDLVAIVKEETELG